MRELNGDLTSEMACGAHAVSAFPLVAIKRCPSAEQYVCSWGAQGASFCFKAPQGCKCKRRRAFPLAQWTHPRARKCHPGVVPAEEGAALELTGADFFLSAMEALSNQSLQLATVRV